MTYCDTCGNQYSDICGTCETLEGVPVKYRKKTNADRIRNMTDEELVKEFIETMDDEMFFNCPVCKTKTESECFASNCEKCWVEWLKQEVEE